MLARLRSWWQQIKKHRVAIGVVGIVLAVVIVLIIVGYRFDWTGFNGNNKSGKTLWDWMQLLIIPLALAVVALLFNLATTRTEQKIAAQRYEQDQHIALDKQREDLLQVYLDCMSDLLLKEKLRTSAPDAEVRNLARVRTITILFQLDERRIGYVFAFLREAGLMSNKPNSSIVSLSDADLYRANFSGANLTQVNLSGANLYGANFGESHLTQANLSGANLTQANLAQANLSEANFSETFLTQANLSGANLTQANLTGAHLSGANLTQANLSGATVTEKQLNRTKSLLGTTMPDGTKHA